MQTSASELRVSLLCISWEHMVAVVLLRLFSSNVPRCCSKFFSEQLSCIVHVQMRPTFLQARFKDVHPALRAT